MLLNVELTAPLTNETRHLFWIWCHCYTQACIPGEWAASVKRRPASPCTALRWQYWFNLLIRSLGLTERKTQPKLLNYSSHAALLTLYSSTDGNSSRYWHLWIKILKKMSGVSSRYLDQTEQNACLLTTPPAAWADFPFKLQIHFNTKCHRKVQTQVDAPVCITYSFFSALPFFLSAWMLKSIWPRRKNLLRIIRFCRKLRVRLRCSRQLTSSFCSRLISEAE